MRELNKTRSSWFFAMILVGSGVLVAPSASSTVLLQLDVATMSQDAPMVVQGFVSWDYAVQNTHIYSYTGVEVTRCVTGDCPETVELKHRGGTVGDSTLYIPGMPSFEVGQEVLLFLRPEPEGEKGKYSVFGMVQGLFLIHQDVETGSKIAIQQLGNVTLAQKQADGTIVASAKKGAIVGEIETMVSLIKAYRKAKDGGAK